VKGREKVLEDEKRQVNGTCDVQIRSRKDDQGFSPYEMCLDRCSGVFCECPAVVIKGALAG
jgi:hypothetical protein